MSNNSGNLKWKATLVMAVTSVLLAACGKSGVSQSSLAPVSDKASIVNGSAVASNSMEGNSTVALYYPRASKPGAISNYCSGTLIAPNIVMTAAHCFADFAQEINASPDDLKNNVLVGFGLKVAKSSSDSAVQFRHVANFMVNPGYVIGSVSQATTVAMQDIALIRLDSNAPDGAQPAELVTDPSVIQSGLNITLVGFGLLSAQPMKMTTKMMEVDVQIDNPAVTSTQFSYKVIDGKSSCSGDSGGPAYIRLADGNLGVLGITSWGDQTCEQLGAYTSVPAFASWIQSTIAIL